MYFSKLTAAIAAVFAAHAVTGAHGAPSCFKDSTKDTYNYYNRIGKGKPTSPPFVADPSKICLLICAPEGISCAEGWSPTQFGECWTCCRDD